MSIQAQVGIPLEKLVTYNSKDSTFLVQDWVMHQLQRESEENILLKREVNIKSNTIISLESKIVLKDQNIESLTKDVQDKNEINKKLTLELKFQKDLYNKCLTLNGQGENSIQGLQWALKKEKAKNLWLKWSTVMTSAAIVVGILREIRRN